MQRHSRGLFRRNSASCGSRVETSGNPKAAHCKTEGSRDSLVTDTAFLKEPTLACINLHNPDNLTFIYPFASCFLRIISFQVLLEIRQQTNIDHNHHITWL